MATKKATTKATTATTDESKEWHVLKNEKTGHVQVLNTKTLEQFRENSPISGDYEEISSHDKETEALAAVLK
jgi:hypothetical protein